MKIFILCPRYLAGEFESLEENFKEYGHQVGVVPVDESHALVNHDNFDAQIMVHSHDRVFHQGPKFLLCGIGGIGVEIVHQTSIQYPTMVAGVLLCLDETGLGKVQADEYSEAYYTILNVVEDSGAHEMDDVCRDFIRCHGQESSNRTPPNYVHINGRIHDLPKSTYFSRFLKKMALEESDALALA